MTDKKWSDQKNQLRTHQNMSNEEKINTIDGLIARHPQYKKMLLDIRKTYEKD